MLCMHGLVVDAAATALLPSAMHLRRHKGAAVESNIVTDVEADLKRAAGAVERILPRDLPSDTREVAALAEEAASTVEKVDPALSPFIEGLESAYKSGVDALGVLREKLDALKGHAVVKEPVEVAPAPVETAPAPVDPVTPTTDTAPTEVLPTPVSDPTPSTGPSTEDDPTVVAVDPTLAVAATEPVEPSTVSVPDTAATSPVGEDVAEGDVVAAFAALTPDEQAAALAAFQSAQSENPTD